MATHVAQGKVYGKSEMKNFALNNVHDIFFENMQI